MTLLELAYPTPEENLACDEALLDACEEGGAGEVLRFWEPEQFFVVLGYANRAETEVDVHACRELNIPVLRRYSGGGAVLQGPGCLNYALVVRMKNDSPLFTISGTNNFIMNRHRVALQRLVPRSVEVHGHCDLAVDGLKFSGNSQRRKERFLLFHGTFLLSLNIGMMERVLRPPSKQPAYRKNRTHRDFLMNLGVLPESVKRVLSEAWKVSESNGRPSGQRIRELVLGRYGRPEWHGRR